MAERGRKMGNKSGKSVQSNNRLIVPGHTLPNEGVVVSKNFLGGGIQMYHAPAFCSCGARSIYSDLVVSERKRWHRTHKQEIIKQEKEQQEQQE